MVTDHLCHSSEVVLHTIIDPPFSSSVRNRSTIYHVVGQGISELFHSIIYPVVGQIISEPFYSCPLFGQVSSELFHSIIYPAVGQIISELFHNLVPQFTLSLGRAFWNLCIIYPVDGQIISEPFYNLPSRWAGQLCIVPQLVLL